MKGMKNIDSIYEELIGNDTKGKKRGSPGKVQFSKSKMKNGGWTRSILEPVFRDYKIDSPYCNIEEYRRFLKRWAIALSFQTDCRITWDAVGLQIEWGITNQKPVDAGYFRGYIRNHALALEVGLIVTKDLPSSAKFEY